MLPRVPVGEWADRVMDWMTDNWEAFFDFLSEYMGVFIETLTEALLTPPALAVVAAFAVLAWLLRSWQFAIGTAVFFSLIISMEQWEAAMQTLALVLVATLVAVLIAVPIGILAARSNAVSAMVKPLLDFMQTMPAFVYLIPAVIFFSIGVVPGLFSTVVFALPPGVRFTELGIRQVDAETVEAGHAFGATSGQILRRIQVPLATPTIMAGINQVIMLALSMAVIAGFVGADGLGKEVVAAISTLNTPKGVEAGLGVVILAIYLDRLTAALGNPSEHRSSLWALLRRWRGSRRGVQTVVPN